MAESDIKIVVEIKNYIEQHGGNYPFWYVGLAEQPEEELIARGVNLDLDRYVYLTAACMEDAKNVKQYFITRLGTDGDPRGIVDQKALNVYAYKKNASTHP
ncbi:MAG: hypothetical protein OEV79_10075 [candidate division WOR-3 bacterium]|nr:hypothetical protein [candidate division WOR-3 bacterium]